MPHRLRRPEFHQRDSVDTFDRSRVELRGAADRIEIHGAMPLERRERLRAHAALPDYGADAISTDDVGLIRLLADARRRARGGHAPAAALLRDNRAAVIQDGAAEVDWWIVLHQVCV